MHVVPDSYGVELQEFNPCHAPGGTPAGGRFCSDKIPGRSERLVKEAQARVDETDFQYRGDGGSEYATFPHDDQVRMDAALSAVIPGASVKIRVPSDILEEVLRDGRLKNQYESKRSSGYIEEDKLGDDDYFRRVIESRILAIEPAFPGKDRPIYGYVATGHSDGAVSLYGDMELVLEDAVKARTTVTMGDSFGLQGDRYGLQDDEPTGQYGMGMPMLRPGWQMLPPGKRDSMLRLLEGRSRAVSTVEGLTAALRAPYIEAQITGGVSLKDIKEVIFHDDGGPSAGIDLQTYGFIRSNTPGRWVRKK